MGPQVNGARPFSSLCHRISGSLYYTENDAIRRISREGRASTVLENIVLTGCTSIPGRETKDRPLLRGLDVDALGTIYVAATGVPLFGNDLYVLEFQNAESDDRREMLPRVGKIAPDGKATIIATVPRR